MTGIGSKNYYFHEYDSSFNRELSPVYWVKTAKMGSREPYNIRKAWHRLDQFASRRRDRKGIVHTVSYERQRDVVGYSKYADDMYFIEQGGTAGRIIENFKGSPDGSILVGPAFGVGYDFPGPECEWQFFPKLPFVNEKSKIMIARKHIDKEYPYYLAYQAFVQAIGRGTRWLATDTRQEDRCENVITDDNCEWFIPRYSHLAPKSFYGDKWNNIEGFYQVRDFLPPPPPRLENRCV
jgi:Rad3-related DNA helicase